MARITGEPIEQVVDAEKPVFFFVERFLPLWPTS
jgi:hypothetical protein